MKQRSFEKLPEFGIRLFPVAPAVLNELPAVIAQRAGRGEVVFRGHIAVLLEAFQLLGVLLEGGLLAGV